MAAIFDPKLFMCRLVARSSRTMTGGNLLLLALVLCSIATGANSEQAAQVQPSLKIANESADGRWVCAANGGLSQIPGHPDLFVGRGSAVTTLDQCHNPPKDSKGAPIWRSFLATYRMDWKNHKTVLADYLIKMPDRPEPGLQLKDLYIGDAYDPFVAEYRGEYWVAFEATIGYHGVAGCGSCIAPLTSDLRHMDLSRLTMIVEPSKNNERSASTPVLLNFHKKFYAYWCLDPPDRLAAMPQNKLVTRGMELEMDKNRCMWGKGSGGKPVLTNDPKLTSLVYDVDPHDASADHTVNVFYAEPFGDKILTISAIGGTCANEVCRSPHQTNPGAWRLALSLADKPLGTNAFRWKIIDLPDLPGNVASYSRLATDDSGHRVLLSVWDHPRRLGVESNDVQFRAGSINLKNRESIKTDVGTLVLQGQNLVLYDVNHKPVWATDNHDKTSETDFHASFQGDGNLVIYRGNRPCWSSKTDCHRDATLVLSSAKPFISIVRKQQQLLLWPWRIAPWPVNPVTRPVIPEGLRSLPFEGYLKEIANYGRSR